MDGKIIKGIGGFYYVQTVNGIIECKARGLFRKNKENLIVGDDVAISLEKEEGKGFITQIYPRKNELIRPAVSNVDQILLLFALEDPKPNFNLLDRFLVMLEQKQLPVIIGFNKADLQSKNVDFVKEYQKIGYLVYVFSAHSSDVSGIRQLLTGKTTALAGPSGVGKSTLVNLWQSNVIMETGDVSRKIGRGKHTTRHVSLIPLGQSGFIVDTPGFTSLDLKAMEYRQIRTYFPEFEEPARHCKFLDCLHDKEAGCAVKEAVAHQEIWKSRYDSYIQLKDELLHGESYPIRKK